MRKVLILNLAFLGACGGQELVSVQDVSDADQTLNAAAVTALQAAAPSLGMGRGDTVRQRLRFVDEKV